MEITVTTNISADIKKVWDFYTNPIHIVNWNFASDDWCCPFATNDLQVGGKLIARMESKDKKWVLILEEFMMKLKLEVYFHLIWEYQESKGSF